MKVLQKAFDSLSLTHQRICDEKDGELRKLNELLEAQDDAWLEEHDAFLDEENASEVGDETLVNLDDVGGWSPEQPDSLSAYVYLHHIR